MRYLDQALIFLVGTAFSAYILLVLLRFLFQITRTDFYNPLAQFLVKATNPLILPLRRILPGIAGIDWGSVVALIVLAVAKVYLTLWIAGLTPPMAAAVVLAAGELFQLTVYVFLVAVFIRAALSWINPYGYHPMNDLLASLTEPLMAPARRLIPAFAGLDLSPVVVVILLELVLILLVQPVLDFGQSLIVR
ncbi:MAG: YggT family protein [Acidiferrobacteraceae bacterium]